MKCPTCSAAELVHDTRDVPYNYKGESTLIPWVTGDFCPACDESILARVFYVTGYQWVLEKLVKVSI